MLAERHMSGEAGTSHGTYWVTVYYREPTYEMQAGAKPAPYRWTYTIVAAGPEQAQAEAGRQFDETSRLSNVGWIRRIMKIEAELAPPWASVA